MNNKTTTQQLKCRRETHGKSTAREARGNGMYIGQRYQRINTAAGPACSPNAVQRKRNAMPTSN
eukprot:5985109-Lingulodinium_polyedra.AAC.1